MKECWINVYKDDLGQWQGFCYSDAYVKAPYGNKLLYRIHVRMK